MIVFAIYLPDLNEIVKRNEPVFRSFAFNSYLDTFTYISLATIMLVSLHFLHGFYLFLFKRAKLIHIKYMFFFFYNSNSTEMECLCVLSIMNIVHVISECLCMRQNRNLRNGCCALSYVLLTMVKS